MQTKIIQTLLLTAVLIGPDVARAMHEDQDSAAGGAPARQTSAEEDEDMEAIKQLVTQLINKKENGLEAAQNDVSTLRTKALKMSPVQSNPFKMAQPHPRLAEVEKELAEKQQLLDSLLLARWQAALSIEKYQKRNGGTWIRWGKENKGKLASVEYWVQELGGIMPSTTKPSIYANPERLIPRQGAPRF